MKSILLFFVCILLASAANASELSTEAEEDRSGVAVYANNGYYSPVTITLTVDADNMAGAVGGPLIVAARSSALLFDLKRKDMRKPWRYSYEYKYQLGVLNAEQSARAVYNLPFAEGSTVKGGQGFNGAFSHQGHSTFAVDFPVKEGTPVYPAREGVVVRVIDKFSEGGTDEKYRPLGNTVWILHDDDTIGRYFHFKHKGVRVKPGQEVGRDTIIGLSGNTGYSSGPHLHFEVCAPNDELEFQSLEFYFTDRKGERFTIKERNTRSIGERVPAGCDSWSFNTRIVFSELLKWSVGYVRV